MTPRTLRKLRDIIVRKRDTASDAAVLLFRQLLKDIIDRPGGTIWSVSSIDSGWKNRGGREIAKKLSEFGKDFGWNIQIAETPEQKRRAGYHEDSTKLIFFIRSPLVDKKKEGKKKF